MNVVRFDTGKAEYQLVATRPVHLIMDIATA